MILINNSIHHGLLWDFPDQRRVYLRVARNHVMNEVGQGSYELNSHDRAFIEMIQREWPAYAGLYL